MIIDPQFHVLHMEYLEWAWHDQKGFYEHSIPYDFPTIIVDFALPFLDVVFWQSELGEEIIKNGKL